MWDKVKCQKFWEVKDAGDQPDGNGKEKEIEVRVVVQTLRLVAYFFFALLIITTIGNYVKIIWETLVTNFS